MSKQHSAAIPRGIILKSKTQHFIKTSCTHEELCLSGDLENKNIKTLELFYSETGFDQRETPTLFPSTARR